MILLKEKFGNYLYILKVYISFILNNINNNNLKIKIKIK